MGGWVKLYRQLIDKAIWQCSTVEQKIVLITILLTVNHEETEWEWQGKKFKCQPGQMVTSLSSLAKKCGDGISVKNVRTALQKFENYGFLANQSTKTGRLITVVNWELYQGYDSTDGKDTGKEAAKSGQSTGKEAATNKNDKKDKNDKNILDSKLDPQTYSYTAQSYSCDSSTPEQKPAEPAPVFSLPLNDKTLYGITGEQLEKWRDYYPAVDVMAELRKMAGWLDGNPGKRKTRRGIGRFIANWLAREQDRGGRAPAPSRGGTPPEKSLSRMVYDGDNADLLSRDLEG